MKNDKSNPPLARGVRQQWEDIPQKIRNRIEEQIGATVVNTETQVGGFSPGVAVRLYTADSRCFFLKAMGTEINATSVIFHRNEAKINARLPENSFAPKLLWSYNDADDTEWLVMLFDNIDGINPPTPWQKNDLERVMQAMCQLSEDLTPSPIERGLIPEASDHFSNRINGWQKLKAGDSTRLQQLDDWSTRHLDALCELEIKAPEAVAGDTLLHFDIRADNMVMTDDAIWFVDWPHACIGAGWVDVIAFAPSVAMQGGMLPEDLIQLHPMCQEADPDSLTAGIASLAGMFSYNALLPAPPGLPTLREFQAGLGEVTRQWLAQRTGWE